MYPPCLNCGKQLFLYRGLCIECAPEAHAALLIANIPAIADDLERGAVASLSPTRLAVRDLPVR